ncbi:MAG: NRDE family protein [Gammaproteobacteria bacterium]
MCLILFSNKEHPVYSLVLGTNRDEFYERPTAPASFWTDAPNMLAGRDLRHGGTWLGIHRNGRFAAVSNYRDPSSDRLQALSRGIVVRDFLLGFAEPLAYLQQLSRKRNQYNYFNLILGKASDIWYYCNRNDEVRSLSSGLYGMSNHLLNTPWLKVEEGKAALRQLISKEKNIHPERILDILADRSIANDYRLPDTGVSLDMERMLSARFISSAHYGTRSSTVLLIDKQGNVTFTERSFDTQSNESKTLRYRFTITASSQTEPLSTVTAT